MPEFEYKAVSKDEYKSGRLHAGSENEAQAMLAEQGLTVVGLRLRNPLEIGFLTNFFVKLDQTLNERLTLTEKILFTSQLSSMIKAGLPLMDALSTFADQKGAVGLARIMNKVILEVQSGVKLSDSLGRFPKVFPSAYLAVVKAGESSGTLAESLGYLAIQLRRENDLLNKVRSALIYPIIVITAMISVMIFISVSIVPKIIMFAQSSGQKMPGYTLALVNAVSFFTSYWYLLISLLVLLLISFISFSKSHFGSRVVGKISIRLPVLGPLVIRYNLSRFARVLGGFYIYGVEVVSSFEILAASLDNPLYRDACTRINEHLTAGRSLADSIASEKELFPSIMTRLIRGAEKTGNLGNTLDKLAEYYEEELQVAMRNMLSLIEPMMIFILGFGVLGLALMVVVPIYKITSTLK